MKSLMVALVFLITSLSAMAADYDKIVTRLKEISSRPHTALFSLGKNDQGTEVLGLVIGDQATATVKHLVVGTHHGNERAAAEVPFHFIDAVLKTYDPSVLYYVIPVLNISGYNADRRLETDANNRQHDSNRDYEDACETKHDFQLKSTSLMADFISREDIVSAVSVHGYVGSFTFPWGMYVKNYATADNAIFIDWAKNVTKINGYRSGTHGDIVYPAEGSFEDWAYLKHGVWSFLMEIRSPSSDLKKDAAALVEFFRLSPKERSRNLNQKLDCVGHILKATNRSRP